jgi:hypothetical protein
MAKEKKKDNCQSVQQLVDSVKTLRQHKPLNSQGRLGLDNGITNTLMSMSANGFVINLLCPCLWPDS